VVKRAFTHPLFAPALMVAIFGLGAATVAFLLFGPGMAPWADTLLTACFGWNADTRRYRLDSLILTLLQPPLFALVIWAFYSDELRAFLARRGGRLVAVASPTVFVALAASLLVTGEISASGAAPTPTDLVSPLRQGRPAPDFALTNHRGQPVSLASLRGRPVVVTFVYADCHASCPLLIARLKALEARSGGNSVFVAVSLDPERDTPASLAGAAVRWALGSRWHLLSGPPSQVKSVVTAYGVQYAPLPDGEIAHENLVLIVDREGRLAFTYRGLAHPEDRQAADLARLAAERG
jgi:protein SCO1